MRRLVVSAFAVALSIMSVFAMAEAVEIVAHRGASHDRPENTLAAVNLGWEQGNAVEIDIYLTADGKIVVIHDPNTKRTAGKDLLIAKSTLAELRELEVGRWKAAEFSGEKIPTLEEVLKTVPKGKRLFIEIKAGPEILPELKRVLDTAGVPPAQTPIIAFAYDTVKAAKVLMPQLKIYWLVSVKPDKETGDLKPTAAELIPQTKAAKLEGLDLGNSPALTPEYVREIQQSGLELYVWTVNDVEKARGYAKLGILGITTDRPGLLKQALGADGK